jgi:hypothetical protein
MERFFIIVARDRPELLRDLTAVYGHASEVEIVLDRRTRHDWARPGMDRRTPQDLKDLEAQGFMVIQTL